MVKIKEAVVSKSEEEKDGLIKQIGEKCVPRQFSLVLKRELKEEGSQTEDIAKSKRKCVEKQDPAEIKVSAPRPTPSLDDVIERSPELLGSLTTAAANSIGACTRLVLRTIIQNAKKSASRENRKRLVPSDVDIACGIAQIDYNLTCPLLRPTPSSDRMYWGRKLTKEHYTIDANSKEMVSHERFCDSIMIKDHWLVVDGIQPCLPENVIPSEVKRRFQEQQHETQRAHGFGVPGIKREPMPEKRMSTQTFSMEHQVLYSEITKILTSGSSLQRQKVLETIETDTGIQFLAGRFVILIAEGTRLHIGTRNIRGLANLLKLTWSLMKNPNIRLEKYLYVLVPSLISCVVSKNMVPILDVSRVGLKAKPTTVTPLGATPPELTADDRERIIRDLEFEFKLREASGKLLAELSSQYQNLNLNVRIIQTLRGVLSGNQDPAAIYGVLCTLFAFGNLTINSVVLPKMHDIYCSLQASRSEIPQVKPTMTKLRKIVVETEASRMEIVQNRTIELVMKIIFENEIFNDRKSADRDVYVNLYAEFGALFYDYALNTEMVDQYTGHLKITRPSLLLKQEAYLEELERRRRIRRSTTTTTTTSSHHHQHQQQQLHNHPMIDEAMLDNLLDDSNRPWSKPAAQLDEQQLEPHLDREKETFFRKPKLFLARKEKSKDGKLVASFLRPLEFGYMPGLPSTKTGGRGIPGHGPAGARETLTRESILGNSLYASRASAENHPLKSVVKDSDELLRRFVSRQDPQAGAIIYGRSMMMTSSGRATLDSEIARAAQQLSAVRLRNSVGTSRAAGKKDEMSRGRFLTTAPRQQIGT